MKSSFNILLTGILSLSGLLAGSSLQAADSPVQSTARPFGLNIVAPVQAAGSDAASSNFQSSYLANMLTLVNSRLGESVSQNNVSTLTLDPAKLTLATDAAVRVYFLGEGAGYLNTLGFNTETSQPADGSFPVNHANAQLIFPNASSQISTVGENFTNPVRTQIEPLLPGDFVDLGKKAAGTILDFFIISDGAGGGYSPFAANPTRNGDREAHMVTFAVAGSPYLIIGFEDVWGGGDRDFNDLVFAVNIGAKNVEHLVSTPEPATLVTMGGFMGMALFGRRRPHGKTALA